PIDVACLPSFPTRRSSDLVSGRVFGIDGNTSLLHEAVRMQLAKRRAGTASTKTRGLISGGGIKPWRQKGTGRARAGSTRSPLWRDRKSTRLNSSHDQISYA